MSKKKLFIYLTLILIGMAVLVGSMINKNKKNFKPTNTLNITKQLDKNQMSPAKNSEMMQSNMAEKTRLNVIAGREDPFAKLFEELATVSEESDFVPVAATPLPTSIEQIPVEPEHGIIRGIVLGNLPAVYVEVKDGRFLKLLVGDSFASGHIVKINSDSVIVNNQGKMQTIRLGE